MKEMIKAEELAAVLELGFDEFNDKFTLNGCPIEDCISLFERFEKEARTRCWEWFAPIEYTGRYKCLVEELDEKNKSKDWWEESKKEDWWEEPAYFGAVNVLAKEIKDFLTGHGFTVRDNATSEL